MDQWFVHLAGKGPQGCNPILAKLARTTLAQTLNVSFFFAGKPSCVKQSGQCAIGCLIIIWRLGVVLFHLPRFGGNFQNGAIRKKKKYTSTWPHKEKGLIVALWMTSWVKQSRFARHTSSGDCHDLKSCPKGPRIKGSPFGAVIKHGLPTGGNQRLESRFSFGK